jgi:3-hydroxybutyryl-CoA dehydratase
MLSAGFISAVLGTRLPGPGAIYLRQELTFLGAVKIGDTITARVEVTEIDAAKGRVKLLTTCDNQEGKRVLTGEAVVSPPRKPKTPV